LVSIPRHGGPLAPDRQDRPEVRSGLGGGGRDSDGVIRPRSRLQRVRDRIDERGSEMASLRARNPRPPGRNVGPCNTDRGPSGSARIHPGTSSPAEGQSRALRLRRVEKRVAEAALDPWPPGTKEGNCAQVRPRPELGDPLLNGRGSPGRRDLSISVSASQRSLFAQVLPK
jgi:hypothetical protein